MSRQRKTAAVLRLLRGEDLETVSRSLGVTAATLSKWRDAFLAGGEAALASRPGDGETHCWETFVEKRSDVGVQYVVHLRAEDPDDQCVQRIALAAPGPES